MTININPNRIGTSSTGIGKSGVGRRQTTASDTPVVKPARANLNVIPEPESLATLIRSAVAALRQGTFWDRGTILNILV
jgi:hypothetical protein